jgi:hypothetical protein
MPIIRQGGVAWTIFETGVPVPGNPGKHSYLVLSLMQAMTITGRYIYNKECLIGKAARILWIYF